MKIRVFTTFNYIYSQYIGFMVPLIIVGLVTQAICKMGAGAGKLLLTAIVLAYCSSVLVGIISYAVSYGFFPKILDGIRLDVAASTEDTVKPFFTLDIPAIMNVTSALVFSFLAGVNDESHRLCHNHNAVTGHTFFVRGHSSVRNDAVCPGIQWRKPGSYDYTLYCHGQFRNSLQCHVRRCYLSCY